MWLHLLFTTVGLIGKKVSNDAAHNLLQALLPQDSRSIYNFHKVLLRHGQRICVFERPRCKQCNLTDICDYYQSIQPLHKGVIPENLTHEEARAF